MDHHDHVALLRGAALPRGGVWADLGSGRGAFTLALAELAGPETEIYSVDRDRAALHSQAAEMAARFPGTAVHYLQSDFTKHLALPQLDGMLMANSLHFVRQKRRVLEKALTYLKPGGFFILVEYNTDRGNVWVPHPISYPSWERLAREAGFGTTEKIGAHPSRFLGEIYAARSKRRESG